MQTTVKGLVKETREPQGKRKYGTVVIDTESDYNPFVPIEGKMDDLSDLQEGDEVEIECWVNGSNGWTSPEGVVRYFVSLTAKNIRLLKSADSGGNESQTEASSASNVPEDEIPF